MVSVVIMAGGPVITESGPLYERIKFKIGKLYYKLVHGETYLGYKPLKLMKLNGCDEEKPMLEYEIENVSNAKSIDDLVVIGEKKRIEKAMPNKFQDENQKCKQQVGGFLENSDVAYNETRAGKKKEFVLYLPCDIPKVKSKSYDSFVNKCKSQTGNYDFMYAIIEKESLKGMERIFQRPFFSVKDDSSSDIKNKKYRIANMIYVNPHNVKHKDKINKLFAKRVQKNYINKLMMALNHPILACYYTFGQLKISQVNDFFSKQLGTKFLLVKLDDPHTALDVDSEEDFKDMQLLEKVYVED